MSGTEHFDGSDQRRSGLSGDDLQIISQLLRDGREEQRLHFDEKITDLQNLFKSAFPNGDPAAHRLAHEEQIKVAAFWADTKGKIFIAGAGAALLAVGHFALWLGGLVGKVLGLTIGK